MIDGPEDGEPVVLSNSIGTTARMWSPQAEALAADGYRVVRYDSRGHGRSPVPPGPYTVPGLGGDVLGLLDRLGIASAHFVGLSIGGMIGIWLGAYAPERVRSLALCCTSAKPGAPNHWRTLLAHAGQAGLETIADDVLERWFTAAWRRDNPKETGRMRAMLTATPLEGYLGAGAALIGLDLTAELGRISAPTTVIAAARDRTFDREHARRIVDGIGEARMATVEHAAHLGNIEQPERFTELIRKHLAGPAGETGDRERRMGT